MSSSLRSMLLLLSYFFASGLSQFVTPPSDLTTTQGHMNIPVRYKEVPTGICELTEGVKSYSGYVDISTNEHIFFWFFEARSVDPQKAPLTVWINGGPGSSSMLGLFQENGPCRLDENLNVVNNTYSWNDVTNMIYIDQPASVGNSYTTAVSGFQSFFGNVYASIVELPNNTCPDWAEPHGCGTFSSWSIQDVTNSTDSSADNFWRVIQGFMGAFPQYSRDGFHFSTESYGGHYGPVYNDYFLQQNKLISNGSLSGAAKINLKSVVIGNGWYDPLVQYAAYYNYSVYPGNPYDFKPFGPKAEARMYNSMYGTGNCYDQTVMCYETQRDDICSASDNFCAYEVEEMLDRVARRDEYDIRELLETDIPPDYFEAYMNSPKVQQAVGAFVNYTSYSYLVGAAFGTTGDDDKTQNAPVDVKSLIDAGVYLAMYNGDADYNCNWLGNQVVADNVGAPGWTSAGFANISTSDDVWHGQVKQSNNFAFARIFESGHEVPFYQPEVALALIERVINGLDIATGMTSVAKGKNYTTSGPSTSTYKEGIATVQYKVIPANWTYNTTTNEPEPPGYGGSRRRGLTRRSKPLPIGKRR